MHADSEEEELPALVGAPMASPGPTLVQVEGRVTTIGAAEPLTNAPHGVRVSALRAQLRRSRGRTVGAARAAPTHESSDDKKEKASREEARPAPRRSASARLGLRRG